MHEIDVDELERVREGATVLDVREPHEWAEARIPGVQWIPMREVPARVEEIDRDRPVYVVCAVGGRSAVVAELLGQAGFDAHNVDGGTNAWIDSGRRVESGT